MKTAVFAYSRQGCQTACRILSLLGAETRAYTLEKYLLPGFRVLYSQVYGECFSWADAIVFVSSCGIAVRKIAPFVQDKRTDPAVVCMDELGTFVIPLLSGHIGGANALARRLAAELNAVPVITTATDIHGKFSVDAWAAERGYRIGSMKAAKAVSAAILEGDVPLCSDFPIVTPLPAGVVSGATGPIGIYLTYRQEDPFENTLRIIPPVLHLGIGCRKNTPCGAIRDAVNRVLERHGLDIRAVKQAASIDLKAGEPGLLEYCREQKIPISFYTPEKLGSVEGDFTASAFVRETTGVDNVCERASKIGAETIIVRKTAVNGVTVAVAAENLEVRFG